MSAACLSMRSLFSIEVMGTPRPWCGYTEWVAAGGNLEDDLDLRSVWTLLRWFILQTEFLGTASKQTLRFPAKLFTLGLFAHSGRLQTPDPLVNHHLSDVVDSCNSVFFGTLWVTQ